MTVRLSLVLAVTLFAVGFPVACTTSDGFTEAADEEAILFSYFKGNGETGVYLQTSGNGLAFEPVNEGEPIFTPPATWKDDQQLARDPSIVYADGTFHMV